MSDVTLSGSATQPSRVRLPASLLWLLAVLAALGLGWYFGRSVTTAPLENSPEVRFTRDMRAHHEQAVDMSLRLLKRTQDAELRIFLTDILLTQQNQIGQMTAWLETWDRPQSGLEPPMQGMATAMGIASQEDVQRISSLPVREAEILFLQLMHRHHQGGILMAQDVLNQNPQAQVARMAQGIVAGQRLELKILEDFLQRRSAQQPPSLEPMRR